MRDRVKIIVNNREIQKRYLGTRLLWESSRLLWEISGAGVYAHSNRKVLYFSNYDAIRTLKNRTITKVILESGGYIPRKIEINILTFSISYNEVELYVMEDDYNKFKEFPISDWNVKFFGN